MNPENSPDDLGGERGYLLRNYSPEDFEAAWADAAHDHEREAAVREVLIRLNSGRWYSLLDTAHHHLAHADLNARDNLATLHSDEFLRWVGVFGLVEHLNTFQELSGVTRPERDDA